MALFQQNNNNDQLASQVMALRSQGLADSVIVGELGQKGFSPQQVSTVLSSLDASAGPDDMPLPDNGMGGSSFASFGSPSAQPGNSSLQAGGAGDDALYSRIEEIAEGLIDEKWDELIGEVKKIVSWKQKVEERQTRLESDLAKLKEDFKTLHQGVLGKLGEYDGAIKDVGTQLHAVGMVFKDVIPQFVENVKELKHVADGMKHGKD